MRVRSSKACRMTGRSMGEGDAADAIQEARTLLSDARTARKVGLSENTMVNRLY